MCDLVSEQIVIRPPLQGVLVEVEDLLGRERDQVRRELRAQPPPRVSVFAPRRKLLRDDVGMGEQKWVGQIIPDRYAAEEDEVQFVREPRRAGLGKCRARVIPRAQDLTLEALDRDCVGLKAAGVCKKLSGSRLSILTNVSATMRPPTGPS